MIGRARRSSRTRATRLLALVLAPVTVASSGLGLGQRGRPVAEFGSVVGPLRTGYDGLGVGDIRAIHGSQVQPVDVPVAGISCRGFSPPAATRDARSALGCHLLGGSVHRATVRPDSGRLFVEDRADPRVHALAAMAQPFAQCRLDQEARLLRDAPRHRVPDFARPLDDVQMQRGERPLAHRAHRSRGGAPPTSNGINPVTNLARVGRRQSQPYPCRPSAGRGFLHQELGSSATISPGDRQVLDERLGVFEAIRRGHLNEPLHGGIQRHLEYPRHVRRTERPQSQPPSPDRLLLHQPTLDEHYRTFAPPRRCGTPISGAPTAAGRAA